MHTRTLGHTGARGLGSRPRLHGHEPVVRSTPAEGQMIASSGPRWNGRHLLRHRRGLRAVPQRGAASVRRASRSAQESSSPPSSVSRSTRTASRPALTQQAGGHPCCCRRLSPSLADRRHRLALPAPCGPRGSHRGGRRHLKELIEAGKVHHFGMSEAGSRRSVVRTPYSRSPRCRASTPCSGASQRTGSFPRGGARHRVRSLQPARSRIPDRSGHRRHRVRRGRHPRVAASLPARSSRGQPCPGGPRHQGGRPAPRGVTVGQGRLHGCSHRSRGSCRRPGTRPARAPRGEPGLRDARSQRRGPGESTASTTVQVQGERYPEAMQRMIDR